MINDVKMLLIPFIFVTFFILSIVLFVKRNKIIAKYDVGYISSFLFAAYMLMPLLMGISILISPDSVNDMEVPVGVIFIYPIIGISIFLFVYRDMTAEYKIGKFFAMLGIGICAGYVLIFRMLRIINFFESDTSSSARPKQTSGPIPNA